MDWAFWIICFGFASATTSALHSSGELMVATLGGSITLPCADSSRSHRSSVTWTITAGVHPTIASDGKVMVPNAKLLWDCSLQIYNIHNDNATTYVCNNGESESRFDLRVINITEEKNPAEGQTELHCYLNNYVSIVPPANCKYPGLLLSWFAEDDTVITNNSKRFHIVKVQNCFLKLYIEPTRPTDHHRKLRCQVSVNGSAKATVSYTTSVENGIEEQFAAVDESLSFACTNASSLGLTNKGQTITTYLHTGSATIIRNVSPLYARDYQCINTGKNYTIRLHTFDITSVLDSESKKVTLTCVLTCANGICDKDFNLTWSEGYSSYSSFSKLNGSLISKLTIELEQLDQSEIACSVLREGVRVATKKWHHNNTVPALAWIAVPLVLLCIAAAGLVCVCKKKLNKDAENLQAHTEMAHMYEEVKDYGPSSKTKATVTSNDSFYDLLQAVN